MVREPSIDDAAALGRVHVRAWQAAYRGGLMPDDYLDGLRSDERAAMWESALAQPLTPRRARYVADVDGVVVGFIVVGPANVAPGGDGAGESSTRSDLGEVYVINVDPDHWGTGVAAELFDAGVGALRSFGIEHAVLWVHPGNARARAFYERRGWSADGEARHETVLGVEVPEVRYAAATRAGEFGSSAIGR